MLVAVAGLCRKQLGEGEDSMELGFLMLLGMIGFWKWQYLNVGDKVDMIAVTKRKLLVATKLL